MADTTPPTGSTTSSATSSASTAASGDILDTILNQGGLVLNPSDEAGAKDMVSTFVKEVLATKGGAVSSDAVAFINQKIAEIDQLLGKQLDLILHNDSFRKLEGSWRGLHYLVMNTFTGTDLKIRLLNAQKQEIANDLKKAVEFDESALFKKVYEAEYDTFGGSPYSCLLADYYFSPDPADMAIVSDLSGVAAAAFAPLITAPDPSMFGLKNLPESGSPYGTGNNL